VAVPLQRSVRETDIVARIGGEEFALVLPETSLEHAVNLAERLRSEISNLSVTGEGHQIKFTASFGVVNRTDGIKNIDALLTDADDALYVAKKKGRNLVKISP
jgi:diguanylate cyclase (GGDEF)-like protein